MGTQEEVLKECRAKLARGAVIEDVIRTLRDGGFSKVHSIKALVDLGQANMNDAKHIVHNSPTWAVVRERDETFHRKLDEEGTPEGTPGHPFRSEVNGDPS